MSLFDLKGTLTEEEFQRLPESLRKRLYARRPRPTWEEILECWPDRVPVTPQTFNTLPEGLRRYYKQRPITELAARCLRNEAAGAKTWSGVPAKRSVFPPRKPVGRPRSDSLWMQEGTWLTRVG